MSYKEIDSPMLGTYYHVHIVHERDAWKRNVVQRPAQLDNQIGPHGDDPLQFGQLYMHVWSTPTPGEDVPITVETLPRQLHADWNEALAAGYPSDTEDEDDPYTTSDSAFVFDKRYCVPYTSSVAANPWQGSLTQLDHWFEPQDAEALLRDWINAAMINGNPPQKRPGRTQPARQPDWDDEWWKAQ